MNAICRFCRFAPAVNAFQHHAYLRHIYASSRAPHVVDQATYSTFVVVVRADGISYFSSLGQGYRGPGTLQLAV